MAVRTTVDDVRVIMETSLLDAVITKYIVISNHIVDEYLLAASLSDTILEEIECWLTAHLIAYTKDRTTETEKLGEAAVKYTGKFDKGLQGTPYGQMVLVLDSSGILASTGKRKAWMTAVESFDD